MVGKSMRYDRYTEKRESVFDPCGHYTTEIMCLTAPLFLSDDNFLGGSLGEFARPRDYHGWCWYELRERCV
jgi:hypothetical protein